MAKKILVPIGFTDITDEIINHTASLAPGKDTEIYIIHVNQFEPELAGYVSGMKKSYKKRNPKNKAIQDDIVNMEKMKEKFISLGLKAHCIIVKGYLAEEIVNFAKQNSIDLIIMGTHRHGILHYALFGSVSRFVINNSPCPILLIPGQILQTD